MISDVFTYIYTYLHISDVCTYIYILVYMANFKHTMCHPPNLTF